MLRSDPSFSRLPQSDQQRLVRELHQVDNMPEATARPAPCPRGGPGAAVSAGERPGKRFGAPVENPAGRSSDNDARRFQKPEGSSAGSAADGAQLQPLPERLQPRGARHPFKPAARGALPAAAMIPLCSGQPGPVSGTSTSPLVRTIAERGRGRPEQNHRAERGGKMQPSPRLRSAQGSAWPHGSARPAEGRSQPFPAARPLRHPRSTR